MRQIIRHASLFSGIGAPELAALWLGWQNVFHCEINEFCNTILSYWFPNSINYENIKTTDFSKWQGQIDILTGGFPCQPFSSAGQRLGADDDRYLWPEMLRVIRQIQPTFVIGENVAGILSMVQPSEEVKVGSTTSLFDENDDIYKKEQQFVIETVCSDLEREGYSVQPFVIPACAVGAPHQRDRVWFVARRNVPTPTIDTLHDGVLRGPSVDEGEGEAQRLQERNEVQQPTEPSGLLRHSSHASNTRAKGMREQQTEVPFPRSTPLAVEIQHSKRIKALKEKGGKTMGSRANGEQRPNGLMDFINFHGILPTPNASEATKWATTYNPDSQMGSGLTAMAINGMLPTPSAADATMGAVLGKNDRIVQTPSGTLRKVTPTTNFSLGLARTVQLLPTPCAQDFKKRGVNSKQKGLPEVFRKCDWLLTPSASDGMRAMMTMDNLKAHRKKNAAQSNLAEQIAHKIGGGTSQLSPLFVEEMMGYPLIYLVLPFLSQDGDRSQ